MRILVTGGAGYIGSHTCVELLLAGHDVVILDNLYNSKIESIGRIESISGKSLCFVRGDMRDAALLGDLFASQTIDAVIHFAGLKSVGESTAQPLEYYQTNITGTLVLLQAMRQAQCKTIIFSSSATVYGQNTAPFVETMPTGKATNPYGNTKIMIEQILQDLVVADPAWHVSLLRYFNPVGAHPSGIMGEDPNGIPLNLMPIISAVAKGQYEALQVYGTDYDTPDGTCVRDYLHVMDLAQGHAKALEYCARTQGCEIFNLGTGNGLSVLELVHAFEESTGIKIPLHYAPRRDGDIAVCYADASKAKRVLGWIAERTPKEMCEDTWRWLCRA
ncbi:MAG: UDP-glucose 4-epimerase GalE [Oscillospiraceae bacterium]|jgi:UDP-glucose 4-epimerase|nr:UDP-glucose 4-epimerase GalE [Oscillospiraceae bacterium]